MRDKNKIFDHKLYTLCTSRGSIKKAEYDDNILCSKILILKRVDDITSLSGDFVVFYFT